MVTCHFSDQEHVRRGAQRVANTVSHRLCSLLLQRVATEHVGIQTREREDKEERVLTIYLDLPWASCSDNRATRQK